MRTALWVGLGVSIAASAMSPSAGACTCPTPEAELAWPEPGAEGVALDTPIVVAVDSSATVRPSLESDGGERIELIEQRRLARSHNNCAPGGFVVLEPAAMLRPNTRYTVTLEPDTKAQLLQEVVSPAAEVVSPVTSAPRAFVTGSAPSGPAREPSIETLLVSGVAADQRTSELWVRLTTDEPLFVHAHTAARSLAYFTPERDPFAIPLDTAECVDLDVTDLAGRTLVQEQRCTPDKCLPRGVLLLNTCVAGPQLLFTWEDWQAAPDGCAAGLADDGTLQCGLRGSQPSRGGAPFLAAALVLALARLTRRRLPR